MEKKIKQSEFARAKNKMHVPPHEMLKTLRKLQGLIQYQLAELKFE